MVMVGTGARSAVPAMALHRLRERMQGPVIVPGGPEYDRARRVWNGSIDRHPALVARCIGVADVLAAVRFAREHDLLVAVRGGGHNVAGAGTCDDGMVIDLSPMKGVRVDPAARTAVAGPGLLWGELDRETQEFGLAVTGGIVSTTGIAGFTLGGGIGWLHRPFGLTVDNLRAADVVTADGRLVRADAFTHPNLYWALRGGGGNFGIVTAFEYDLHPIGPDLMSGLVLYRAEDLGAVGRGFRDMVAAAPDELALLLVLRRAPAAPYLPTELHGRPVVGVVGCYAGRPDAGARAMAPLRDFAPPVADRLSVRAYTEFQSMMDGSWTEGYGNYWKAEFLARVPDTALDVLGEHLAGITSPLSDLKLTALGGAAGRVPAGATAFAHRDAPYVLNINARWPLGDGPDAHIAWARDLWAAMRAYSAGGPYVNFLNDEGADRVRAAYGETTYRRLVAVKNAYDADNLFRVNQNIPPDPH
jgi:FAD/FMN-containing dehydrogenase